MSLTLTRPAAGLALLAVLAAGCGGTAAVAHSGRTQPGPAATAKTRAAARHHAPARRTPAATTPPASPATTPPATAPAPVANPIPQGNGGDQDTDNNGGPSDGDGDI